MLQYAFSMYWGVIDRLQYSLACKLGLHPLIIAHFRTITTNFEKVASSMTIELPGGLLALVQCNNMLSICIGERLNACSIV